MEEPCETITFQRFELDYRRRLLRADGAALALHSRTFDMLVLLIAERDRVLTRDEIIAHVWAGLAVGENNLTVQMSSLRKILAEHGGDGLIITVPGRGYRFVGDIAAAAPEPSAPAPPSLPPASLPIPPPAAPARPRSRPLAAALAGMAAAALLYFGATQLFWRSPAPPRLSIAVLPFRDLSDGATHGYMADAITDDLTTDLAHIPGSIVIARESTAAVKLGSPQAIGHALAVRYLLEGSVRAEATSVHINAELLDASTGRQLWAQRFDTPAGSLAETQTDIVRRIASAMDAELTNIESVRSLHDRPDDPDAQDLFFRARAIVERDDTQAGFTQAQTLLEQAIQLQPNYADALAELGLTLVLKTVSADDPSARADLEEGRQIIGRALGLRPPNSTALAAAARLHEVDGDCMDASQSADAALRLEPNSIDALAVLAKCAANSGHLDEAAAFEQALIRLNPDSGRNRPRLVLLSQIRLLQGRYPEAIALGYQSLAGDAAPDSGASCMDRLEYARVLLIAATALNGDIDRARQLYRAYAAIWPNRSVWRFAAMVASDMASQPGFTNLKTGLAAAGMKLFVDEHATNDKAHGPSACPLDSAPAALPGATSIDTAALQTLRSHTSPILIDLGRGVAVPQGAFWFDRRLRPGTDTQWVDSVLDAIPKNPATPIVVLGSGTYGTEAAAAIAHLAASRYGTLYWYRGGEEAWAAANMPSVDRRLKN